MNKVLQMMLRRVYYYIGDINDSHAISCFVVSDSAAVCGCYFTTPFGLKQFPTFTRHRHIIYKIKYE